MSARSTIRRKGRPLPKDGFLGRLLDPIDRLSETIFSVLIVLSFTLAFRIFKLGELGGQQPTNQDVRDLLYAAMGATLAWGLIDGVMYVLMEVFQRSERHRLLRQLQSAESDQEGVRVVADELDYILEPISGEGDRQTLYRSIYHQLRGGEPRPVGFKREDFTGALGCVVVALLAVAPSLATLALLREQGTLAIRASNIVSFIVLFATGYQWGQYTGASPWRTGLLLVAVAALMVGIAIPLGG